MFERIDYIVKQIDGDYAYLERLEKPEGQDDELKCVARALLPPEIMEGIYETGKFFMNKR